MPVSLLDKLRAVDKPRPAPASAAPHPANECFHMEARIGRDAFPARLSLSAQTLGWMLGKNCPDEIDPARVVYLDTETTGLSVGSGTIAFLVGAGYFEQDGSFVVHQWLMRDYPEERFVLTALSAMLMDCDLLVTFNGRTFDVPLLEARMLMNRLPMRTLENISHADLLHPARRVWKLRLGSCRLSRLEEEIFHAPREHDLPGSLVPERFFQYLKTGDFSLFQDVLDHNRQDIVTLAKLLYRLAEVYEKPEQQSFLEDIFSVGRALEKQGETDLARKCYHLCSGGHIGVLAQMNLGRSYARFQQTDQAIAAYERMIARREGGLAPYIELAKLYEHRKRDAKKALEITQAALLKASEPMLLGKSAMQDEQNALQYRYMRLMRKALMKEAR